MGFDAALVSLLVLAVFAAFIWERYPPEVVALGACALLLVSGILDTSEFLSVFSSSAPITIAMMFIISSALERTGIIQILGDALKRIAAGSMLRAMLVMMATVMMASAFINNTPVVIMLTPVVISLANSLRISASKLLIPLSFASIFGGSLTLVGTSTNILMSTVAAQTGQPEIGMFEMTLPGLIFAGAGMLYMLLVGRHLLPDRSSLSNVLKNQPQRNFTAEVLVSHDSSYIGRTLTSLHLGGDQARVIDVVREDRSLRHSMSELRLGAGDRIVIETNAGELLSLKENGQIEFKDPDDAYEPVRVHQTAFMEASIGHRSDLIGKRLADLRLRRRYGIYVLALHRSDATFSSDFDNISLQFADTLLLEGPADGIRQLLDTGDVVNLSYPEDRPIRKAKAPLALGIMAAVMLLAAIGVMPIAGLAVIGAVLVMITGCVDADEAFDAIDWRILFLIFGMLGLSLGLEKSGAVQLLVGSVAGFADTIGPLAVLAAIYVLTSLLTEMVSNNAVAVLVGPIAVALAGQLGLDARPFIMAVMFAASASFATPIGYQTNTFVYGAGGYRFTDFLRVGVPLNILFALLSVIVLPYFFPF